MFAKASCLSLPVASESIDLIFTDPPYPTEYLYTYEWLANEAMRVLKPGGFVLAMCGGLHLPKIYKFFEQSGLTYFYEFFHRSNNMSVTVWKDGKYPILARGKTIIAYSKGTSYPQIGGVHSMFETNEGWSEAKRYHRWGQDVNTCRYYIEYFSNVGDLVLDPFVGGGTTVIAAELVGRKAVGFDVDMQAVITSRNRRNTTEIPMQIGMML